jgi:hypothetical protein
MVERRDFMPATKSISNRLNKVVFCVFFCLMIGYTVGCQRNGNAIPEEPSGAPVAENLTPEEKEQINQQYFSDPSFNELNSLPDYIHQTLPFVPIHTFQNGQTLYFLTTPFINPQDAELISSLRNISEYGGCSEIWSWDLPTDYLQKRLVKLDYYPNPRSDLSEETNQNLIGTTHGKISTIVDIAENGDIVFTESLGEGMMHFTTIQYVYHIVSDTISITDYKPGRPETYSPKELQEKKEQSIHSDTLSLFRSVSDIVWKEKKDTLHFSYFNTECLYVLQYNIAAPKNAKREIYHEIGAYSLSNQKYSPILRKWIHELDLDPFIALELIPTSNHLSIHDWCGFSKEPRTNQVYYYNSDEGTIQYMAEAPNTTPETGFYEVVSNGNMK